MTAIGQEIGSSQTGYCRRCDATHARAFCPDCGLRLIPAAEHDNDEDLARTELARAAREGYPS